MKRFRTLIVASIAGLTILAIGAAWFLRKDDETPLPDLSPIAFALFDNCVSAALENTPLTYETDLSEMPALTNLPDDSPAFEAISLLLGERFECEVALEKGFFEASAVRARLETIRLADFDGKDGDCSWKTIQSDQIVSALRCPISRQTEPKNSFRLHFGIIADDSMLLWLQPIMTFDAEGLMTLTP